MPDALPVGVAAVQLLALEASAASGGLIYVTTSERRAEAIGRFLAALAPERTVIVFPPWDCLPYDRASPSREAMGRRMAALHAMAGRGRQGTIVITTPDAVLQRVPPRSAVKSLEIRSGAKIDPEAMRSFCEGAGYILDERVDEPGEAAFRGEVIDIFPAGHRSPVRLEILGGKVQSIRCYDPLSQRTMDELSELAIVPVSELPASEEGREPGAEHRLPQAYAKLATLLDYLPKARLVADPAAEGRAQAVLRLIAEAHKDRLQSATAQDGSRPALPPEALYLTASEWRDLLEARGAALAPADGFEAVPAFAAASRPQRTFASFLREQSLQGRRIVLAGAADEDLVRLSRRAGRIVEQKPEPAANWAHVLSVPEGALLTLKTGLDTGFVDAGSGVALVAARDVLGSRAASAEDEAAAVAPWQMEAADLRLGDLVVHADHGVGVLRDLQQIETPAAAGEAIRLAYAKDAVLLTPAEEAAKLWRYGSEEGAVALDRLDGDAWQKRRAKIQVELDSTAATLVEIAAKRANTQAPKLAAPERDYERFAARFPYTETPDQRRAIAAILDDLASGRPMDRLVVGDVGFGKTEVALRAAAAAALAGRQVAVVAPTTVLARQHFNTFTRRFAGFGIEVGHLSRVVPAKEARRVKAGLADRSVRVVVGTHALTGKGVEFADLGLLVIDEEQRFGAAHKQALRRLGEAAHVLTMTATPIPRTLQTALVGLQDLSTILTAPSKRRPIRTFTAPFDAATLRNALVREKRRGGQSFVVVPRIEDIEPTAERLRTLAPDLDLRIAHGKLPAASIDATMVEFAEGGGDLLLATSIIESGLDVPRANTMVVLRADLFGLAQLHQLRGRVGRGAAQGICYLLTEPDKELPEATARRLGTLQAFDRLGAGMAISARDLDLRGAGDLLGEEQAGHVKLIGLSLYQELLARALKQARGEPASDWTTEFQIDAAASVPEDYIPEAEIRLNLYHRAARAAEPAEVERLAEEIEDRFGPPPVPVQNLLALAGARALARTLKVTRIAAGPQAIALSFEPGLEPERRFAEAMKRFNGALEWTGERLLFRRASETPEERSRLVLELLEELA